MIIIMFMCMRISSCSTTTTTTTTTTTSSSSSSSSGNIIITIVIIIIIAVIRQVAPSDVPRLAPEVIILYVTVSFHNFKSQNFKLSV